MQNEDSLAMITSMHAKCTKKSIKKKFLLSFKNCLHLGNLLFTCKIIFSLHGMNASSQRAQKHVCRRAQLSTKSLVICSRQNREIGHGRMTCEEKSAKVSSLMSLMQKKPSHPSSHTISEMKNFRVKSKACLYQRITERSL